MLTHAHTTHIAAPLSWDDLAQRHGPQRPPLPPANGDLSCRYCRAAPGLRWALPRGEDGRQLWLCELCADAAQRLGRLPQPPPDPPGCQFAVEVMPGGRTAFVEAFAVDGEVRRIGFAVVYRAEAGDDATYRIDASGEAVATRHHSTAACLAEAIGEAKALLAERRSR